MVVIALISVRIKWDWEHECIFFYMYFTAITKLIILALVAVAYVSATYYKPTHPVYPPHKPSYYGKSV